MPFSKLKGSVVCEMRTKKGKEGKSERERELLRKTTLLLFFSPDRKCKKKMQEILKIDKPKELQKCSSL